MGPGELKRVSYLCEETVTFGLLDFCYVGAYLSKEHCGGTSTERVSALETHSKDIILHITSRAFRRKSGDIVIPPSVRRSVRPSVMSHHCS